MIPTRTPNKFNRNLTPRPPLQPWANWTRWTNLLFHEYSVIIVFSKSTSNIDLSLWLFWKGNCFRIVYREFKQIFIFWSIVVQLRRSTEFLLLIVEQLNFKANAQEHVARCIRALFNLHFDLVKHWFIIIDPLELWLIIPFYGQTMLHYDSIRELCVRTGWYEGWKFQ